MSLVSEYQTLLIDEQLKTQAQGGVTLSASDVLDQMNASTSGLDLTAPQFSSSDYTVTRGEESSVSKFKAGFEAINRDLTVLYREMGNLAGVTNQAFERWALETKKVEKQLIDLEDRVENLLLLTQDTEGYHSILVDNFTDRTFVDTSETTALVDIGSGIIQLPPSLVGSNRIFLTDLVLGKDVSFKVRTRTNYADRSDEGDLRNPLYQQSDTWWTSVSMTKRAPVTSELLVKLGSDPVPLSRIYLELRDSAEGSPVSITPLYSVDNRTFKQVPSTSFTQMAKTRATFSFKEVQAKYIKFLLTKTSPDQSSTNQFFGYQFGFKQISFFSEGYEVDSAKSVITEPLSVLDTEGSVLPFEKLTLEVCDRIETNTDIQYFVTTSNTSTVPLSSPLWVPISPVNRESPQFPIILNIGNVTEKEYASVSISHDISGTAGLVSPAASFNLLSTTAGSVVTDAVVATTQRYAFSSAGERILNYQLKHKAYSGSGYAPLSYKEGSLVLFRNEGVKGLAVDDATTEIRGVQRGWKFEEPYYSCVVEIRNPEGIEIDFGGQEVIVDGISLSGVVTRDVLFGKTLSSSGLHTISVHKDNWVPVGPELLTESALKTADPLYPYNHKLLIEGYEYGLTYTETRIYSGVDLFAELIMSRVSPFDMALNISEDNYDVYSLDVDVASSHTGGNGPTQVFLLKVDEKNPDFQNERFVIRFKLINELRSYLRLRADLTTEDSSVTPVLESYKIKLG